MDAPGIRGDQQQLGHLVGRGFHGRPDTDTVSHADGDAHPHSNPYAHIEPHAITVANSDSDSDSDAHAFAHADSDSQAHAKPDSDANSDAITHSNGDTDPNANCDAYSDTIADFDTLTFADAYVDSDTFADADDRRYYASGWQSRHLLSRLAGAERWDATLSRLRQRGRTATRTRPQYLQRRDKRDSRRRGCLEIHGPRH
jgi:hypothetical protein